MRTIFATETTHTDHLVVFPDGHQYPVEAYIRQMDPRMFFVYLRYPDGSEEHSSAVYRRYRDALDAGMLWAASATIRYCKGEN